MSDLHGDLEALLAEAHRRAEQRALEREAAAARQADELLAGAEEAARRTLDERHLHADAEAGALRERLLALGDMAAKRVMLTRREALMDSVWDAAREHLRATADDPESYLAALRGLARLGARTLLTSEVELASDARGHALLTPDRLELWGRQDGVRYRRADAPIGIRGGIEARAGRLRFDGSFDARLEQARGALRGRVLEWLNPGGPAPAGERRSAPA